jgi:hypothetical protein
MARTFWPNESAVGHTLQVVNGAQTRTYRIVGVCRDHKQHGVLESLRRSSISPMRSVRIRRTSSSSRAPPAARMRCWPHAARAARDGAGPRVHGQFDDGAEPGASLMPARVGAMLARAFGGLGTLLAAIGLYGVIAFSVARRTREIGVRMAIGANPGDVLSMVMRQGFSIVAIGLVTGGLLAAGAASALRGVLYGITPFDPIAWGLALTAMIGAAAVANFVPARRAMRVDPMTALRTE